MGYRLLDTCLKVEVSLHSLLRVEVEGDRTSLHVDQERRHGQLLQTLGQGLLYFPDQVVAYLGVVALVGVLRL